MESVIEERVPSIRKTSKFIVRMPVVDKLKAFANALPDEPRSQFKARYGKIIDLLSVNVQVEAISALAQYYDTPLRCFTFSNFQLAPTLEEFAHIMGQPLEKGKPYHFHGNYPRIEKVAKELRVDQMCLINEKQKEKTPRGISRICMEALMNSLVEIKDWPILIDVLALAIYDLVLFPSAGDMVSDAALDVFMAQKCRGENPTYAILADVYYTMSFCHEKKGKRIICCIPILYVWLTTHAFRRSYEAHCPIVDLRRLGLKIHSAREWVQILVELKEDLVRWYPQRMQTKEVICQCGDFPNVPLVGTLGCINYNPGLALRQLGYPLKDPPTETSTMPFMTDLSNEEMRGKIWRAWKNVICKSKELGKRSCGASSEYKQWVRERVEKIKLPFRGPSFNEQQDTDDILEESEDMRDMKEKMAKLQAEKDSLEDELREIRSSFQSLKLEHGEKAQSLDQVNKRARIDKASLDRTKVCLKTANKELGLRNVERNRVVRENERLKESLRNRRQQIDLLKSQLVEQATQHELVRKVDEQAFLDAIQGYQNHLEEKHAKIEEISKGRESLLEENWNLKGDIMNLEAARDDLITLKMQMDEKIAEYEARIRNERQEVKHVVSMYRATIEKKNEEIRGLGQWAAERDHCMGLINSFEENYSHARDEIGHWARELKDIEMIPELVQNADAAVNPLTTPRAAIDLIEMCKFLVGKANKLIKCNREN